MVNKTISKTTSTKVRSSRRKTSQVKPLRPSSGNSSCSVQVPVLTHEQITERAKKIWQDRGCVPGFDEQNWHEAERQLKAELEVH